MSQSLKRGLAVLEALGAQEMLGVSDLARLVGLDKAVVSRIVSACEADGWVVRVGSKVALGPRAILLGHGSAETALVRRAEELVHAIAGVTGLDAHALQLVGANAFCIAMAGGREFPATVGALRIGQGFPMWASAAGKALAAQLDDRALDKLLPAGEWQSFTPATVRTRDELSKQLAAIRTGEPAWDLEEWGEGRACIAVPWPQQSHVPVALDVIGSKERVLAVQDRAIRALRRSVEAGASAEAVILAATADEPADQLVAR
jgi:IclR family acetate operon transcriptional repressor